MLQISLPSPSYTGGHYRLVGPQIFCLYLNDCKISNCQPYVRLDVKRPFISIGNDMFNYFHQKVWMENIFLPDQTHSSKLSFESKIWRLVWIGWEGADSIRLRVLWGGQVKCIISLNFICVVKYTQKYFSRQLEIPVFFYKYFPALFQTSYDRPESAYAFYEDSSLAAAVNGDVLADDDQGKQPTQQPQFMMWRW